MAIKHRTPGRKRLPIDWNQVDRLLEAGADGVEIASRLGCYPDTLYNACEREHKTGFSAYAARKRASGDAILRAKQFETAMKGNVSMLIWLGKNRLGQTDKMHHSGIDPFSDLLERITDEQLDTLAGIAESVNTKPGIDSGGTV